MLRCEGRDPFICELLFRHTERIADGENTRIKYADDISGIGFRQDFAVICHDLLRLGKSHNSLALDMLDVHIRLKFAGTDSHKCDSVTVRFVHVRLNLEHERAEVMLYRVNQSDVRAARQRHRRHL